MWQDWIIAGVQIVFAISLIPSVLHKENKPSLSTSIFTSAGLYTLSAVYVSLALWFAAIMAASIATLWATLAYQRYRIDARKQN